MADGEMEELAELIGGDRESSYDEVTRNVPTMFATVEIEHT